MNDLENDLATCDLVFTYGTLKRGYGNSRLLEQRDAEWLKEDCTVDKYVMGNVGFPYVFDTPVLRDILEDEDFFKPVVGHLWRIPDTLCFRSLDGLEGYPRHYDRKVELLSSGQKAWMYVQRDHTVLYHCNLPHDITEAKWNWSY